MFTITGYKMTDEDFVDLKEKISALIFDYDGDGYIYPQEEHCNELAEKILTNIFDIKVIEEVVE